jgi:HEAT repeat protein
MKHPLFSRIALLALCALAPAAFAGAEQTANDPAPKLDDAGAATAKLAAQGDPKSRMAAINALAARNDQSAAPALLQYAGESNLEVSAAACTALAKVGTDKELDGLIRLVLAGKTPCAAAALQVVAGRAKDKSAAAQKVIALTQTAEPRQAATIFEILTMLGGQEALVAVSTSAASSNEQVKDAAIRALAAWPDFPAARGLLVVATDMHGKPIHKALAVQGIARLVKASGNEPAAARLKVALAALNLANRDEDKKLLLSAIVSVPDKAAGEAIKPFLSVPRFQREAGLASLKLAETLLKTDKPAAKELAQAVKQAGLSDDFTRRADAILKKN